MKTFSRQADRVHAVREHHSGQRNNKTGLVPAWQLKNDLRDYDKYSQTACTECDKDNGIRLNASIREGSHGNPSSHDYHEENHGYDERWLIGFENVCQYVTDKQQLGQHADVRVNGLQRIQTPTPHDKDEYCYGHETDEQTGDRYGGNGCHRGLNTLPEVFFAKSAKRL